MTNCSPKQRRLPTLQLPALFRSAPRSRILSLATDRLSCVRLEAMNKRSREKLIFAAFLEVAPVFAGEAISCWEQPPRESDFPDVICTTESGRRIGAELGEWLNQTEMTIAKRDERIQEDLLAAVGDQGPNDTQHIFMVWLMPKLRIRFIAADSQEFRSQILKCIHDADERWPTERFWHSPQGHILRGQELDPYPALRRYLRGLHLHPAQWNGRALQYGDWITFPFRCGSFSEETMSVPLLELLADKKRHYGGAGTAFDHLTLLVYYSRAILYNSPAETATRSFEQLVSLARKSLDGTPAPFNSIYLFLAFNAGRALRVC